jgi:tetratricopeptide (TPR) repeat protein
MRRLAMTLIGMILIVSAAPIVWANAVPDVPRTDSIEAARAAEMKGDLARAHNNYSLAASEYEKALRNDPRNPTLHNKLGIADLKLNNRNLARKQFAQALKVDPRNVSALINLGAVAYLDKKYKTSVKYLKQALELDESSAPAHLNLAEAWMGLNEVDHAMVEYARAIELDADILTTSEEGVAAQLSTPEQRARVNYLIAKAYAKRGNIDGALEYLTRAKDGHFSDLHKVYKDQEFAVLWQDPRLAKIVKP